MKNLLFLFLVLIVACSKSPQQGVSLHQKMELEGNQKQILFRPPNHPASRQAYINWSQPRGEVPLPPSSPWSVQLHEAEVKDTYIRNEGLYGNDNFGTSPFLIVGERPNSGFRRILFQFSNATINEMVQRKKRNQRIFLQLFKHGNSYAEKPMPVVLKPILPNESSVQRTWIEGDMGLDQFLDGVCWGGEGVPKPFQQPRVHHSYEWQQILWAPNGQWAELDLTEIFLLWESRQIENFGLMITMANEDLGSGMGDHLYASSSYGNPMGHPYLALR